MPHLGIDRMGVGDRWLDGRHAGARMGDHLPEARAFDRADRQLHAGQRPADRLGSDRASVDPPRPDAGAAATTTTPNPATVRPRAWRSPARSPRSRFAATTRSPSGSGATSPIVSQVGDTFGLWQEFEVERYLQYHGDKLVRRFDANSYLIIGKAMDLHDVARGRGILERAMARITVPNLTIGINSDILYPSYQQRHLSRAVERGRRAERVRRDRLAPRTRRIPHPLRRDR